jgi:hypothetical protein
MTAALPGHFHLVSAGDAELVRSYTGNQGGMLSCEYAFANLMAWNARYRLACHEHDQQLWIYGAAADFLYFPLGRTPAPDELQDASRRLRRQGFSGRLALIPVDYYQRHRQQLETMFTWESSHDYYEYVYRTDDLADLPGQKLSPKRNLINQFLRENHDWRSRALDVRADQDAVLEVARTWAENKAGDLQAVQEDLDALAAAFACWPAAGFSGTVLEVEGRVVAFAVHSMLTDLMADIHFEKALSTCKGSAQMINRETARQLRGKAIWTNREQDLGLPGLRRAKLSYDPEYMIELGLLHPRHD